jgi:hypothetical protein
VNLAARSAAAALAEFSGRTRIRGGASLLLVLLLALTFTFTLALAGCRLRECEPTAHNGDQRGEQLAPAA